MEQNNNIPKKAGRPAGSTSQKGDRLKKKNKKLIIGSLRENMGILAPALSVASISRQTFNKYYNEDPIFREEIDDIREASVDYVESQLFKQIKGGGAAQTIFYLKTKGKHRGYIEQNDTNMTIDAVKIKYIIPTEEDNKIANTEEHIYPLDNQAITINLPDKQ